MSKANRIILVVGLFVITLVITNPSEVGYLNKIGEEYGNVHHGLSFSAAQLLEIGEGQRNNYIILSNYRYSFGNIAVEYFGFCGMIFKTGSESDLPNQNDDSSEKVIA